MTDALLKLAGVHTHIGAYHILRGVSFEVSESEVTVLLGRNGAGKTTTLRTIMGLWKASAGRIDFANQAIPAGDTSAIARSGVAYVPETMGIFSGLTVHQNLLLATRYGKFSDERLDTLLRLFPPLRKFWNSSAGHLSGGQKQMLSIGRAIVEPRKLILIDEPTKGIAPAIVDDLIDAIHVLKREGTAVLLVEQNFSFASDVGDKVAVMDDGRIVYTGEMSTLAADDALQMRYLGLSLNPT